MDTTATYVTREDSASRVREYWEILWRGRWTALSITGLVVLLTALYTFLQTPIYRATAVVEIQPQARRLAPGQDVSGLGAAGYGWFAEEKYHNTQMEIIRSRDVAERVIKRLGLANHPMFQDHPDPVAAFRSMIQVDPRPETGLIEISIEGADRLQITEWVNAVADAYVERNLEKARQNVEVAVQTIRTQIAPLESELVQAEEGKYQLLREVQLFDPEERQAALRRILAQYNEELAKTQIEVERLRALLDRIGTPGSTPPDPRTIPEFRDNRVLQDLLAQRSQLQKELETLKLQFRPDHRVYREKQSELDELEAQIRQEVELFRQNIHNQYSIALQTKRSLEKKIRNVEEAALEMERASSQYEIAKTSVDTKKRIYDLISKTMEEVQLAAQLLTNNVTVLDYSTPPLVPVKPRKRQNLFLGLVLGLSLGAGTVFLLDYLDNTIRTTEDVERYLGLSALSVVPRIREGKLESHAVKEAFQTLRTSLIFSSAGHPRRVLLVTSASPQEGKSSVAANLARTLARGGDRVLLLDCDLRRPTQHRHQGVSRDRGLTNLLLDPDPLGHWRSYVVATGTPRLGVIPSGPLPPNPPELLGTETFKDLLHQAAGDYDWVVVDSPPAASLADTLVLAQLSDLVLIVVRHNATDRDLASKVVQRLRKVKASLVGCVLNDVDLQRAGGREYYYAGYYYTRGEGDEAGAAPAEGAAGGPSAGAAGV